ncbi:hypothetical protein Z950_595 [Sulfitobacter mediterraneus KCTC 32188]|nr:hypothetical protein Z950_595 [Sulfitobacter mediterraneus KCTC 32188]
MILHIDEVIGAKEQKSKVDKKTDFEKNTTKLRSKERKLDAIKAVKPVSPN